MSRKSKKNRLNRHHCYPSKDTRHDREIKIVNAELHRRYHLLVDDRTPRQAIRLIAKNFMPKDMEKLLLEMLK